MSSSYKTPPKDTVSIEQADRHQAASTTSKCDIGMNSRNEERTAAAMKRVSSAPGLSANDELPKVVIGICAMDKKARSKQMKEIVERLHHTGEFEIVVFGDDTILNKPVEEWPICQSLLSWHSEGFPLKKAQAYAALRKPYLVNDIFSQDILLDRRQVYRRLSENGIPVPTHIIIDRDTLRPGQEDPDGFIETEDYVELNGERIEKPFVEKPASGEDHNIYIYYPHSMGGGVKRLFRKVDNKSGDYDPTHPGTVRRDGSYIYEEFLTTGGTDVKVYTVGPRYAHAEARKSPVVDGKVQRTADGKEVRFPVLLSPQEKEIARMVCLAFGQRVCGFDLLRSERGKSYVCDVNGWSFVKNSYKYYDDAAGILRMVILSAVAPHRLLMAPSAPKIITDMTAAKSGAMESSHNMPYSVSYDDVRSPLMAGADDGRHSADEELRCVLAVIRHGDRTPKQKMKMKVTQPSILALLHKYMDSKGKQAKLKSPNELQELLDVTRALLDELDVQQKAAAAGGEGSGSIVLDPEADETREKFRIMKTVLEQGGGQFAGINRKVQLKPVRWAPPEEGSGSDAVPRVSEALLILKHGGVLTHAGRQQAGALGSLFRNIMYPQNGPQGGLLRLHSTYRHDLKIYTSDEGRVQSSAAAFTKGLLDLEGAALTPILVSLVNKDAGMLDAFGKGASTDINLAKQELYAQMTWDQEKNMSAYAEPQATVPLAGNSPPMSPKTEIGNAISSDELGGSRSAASSPAPITRPGSGFGASLASSTTSSAVNIPGQQQQQQPQQPRLLSRNASAGSNASSIADALNGGLKHLHSIDNEQLPGSSNIPGRPHIYPMPHNPLELLKRLYELLKAVVDQLRQKCLEEARSDEKPKGYSALTQDPRDWQLDSGKPCGGEKLLLLFDRWRKLLKAFYSEKKGHFDISKVPDIYDAAKYDSIHNTHLGVDLREVYHVAKTLAAAVIPNEYGIVPSSKLRIGSMIAAQLLGKLLCDLASMREESFATSGPLHNDDSNVADNLADEMHHLDLRHYTTTSTTTTTRDTAAAAVKEKQEADAESLVTAGSVAHGGNATVGINMNAVSSSPEPTTGTNGSSDQDAATNKDTTDTGDNADLRGNEHDDEEEDTVLHRLCPTYAQDVNSPLRHVRTRIYFTSESHCHSLINVLRYSQIGTQEGEGLLSEEGQRVVREAEELDYMTHVVFRMFENKTLALEDPRRFRVEILFSPGAAYNPFENAAEEPHVLPVAPRVAIHVGDEGGVPLAKMESMLKPYSKPFKRVHEPYSLRSNALDTQASELDYWM